jgi:hypothetical protein
VVWQKWLLNSETRFWSSMVSQRLIFLKDSSKNEPLVCNSRTITAFLGEGCAYFMMKKVVVLVVACHVQDCNTAASQWLIRWKDPSPSPKFCRNTPCCLWILVESFFRRKTCQYKANNLLSLTWLKPPNGGYYWTYLVCWSVKSRMQ